MVVIPQYLVRVPKDAEGCRDEEIYEEVYRQPPQSLNTIEDSKQVSQHTKY